MHPYLHELPQLVLHAPPQVALHCLPHNAAQLLVQPPPQVPLHVLHPPPPSVSNSSSYSHEDNPTGRILMARMGRATPAARLKKRLRDRISSFSSTLFLFSIQFIYFCVCRNGIRVSRKDDCGHLFLQTCRVSEGLCETSVSCKQVPDQVPYNNMRPLVLGLLTP